MFAFRRRFVALIAAFALAAAVAPAAAQQKTAIKVSSLTLPVIAPLVWNIMKTRGLDEKHGFTLEIQAYPAISAYYAGFATGETDVVLGGPTVFQKLYQEGVPARIIGTGITLADLVIFAKDPAIKSLADLKGKQIAMDMGSAQFQVVKIYALAKGIDLGKDITVVNANFAVARAQLEAGRVEAAMVIEPLASIITKQNPDWKIIFNGAEGWKDVTGEAGWELVPAMRAGLIEKDPTAPKKLIAALQDVAKVFHDETAAADKIGAETTKLPPGILSAAISGGRFRVDVKPMSDAAARKSVKDMMELAVKAGFYTQVPDDKIFHAQ
ncbi:MAG TPA: ABC transporter substrate-binding protein [Pseudolabrys sp.]|nr:ABC transporter substrate-binding protein [Pseudolabrys sp.]